MGARVTTATGTTTGAALAETLVRVSRVVQAVFADVARQNDLTPQQTQLLCILHNGPVGMGELGRLLHLEKSSLTGLIDRVERRGLVARVRDENDRRALRVAVTDEGSRLGMRTHNQVTERLQALTAALIDDDVRRAAELLETLLLATGDRAGGAATWTIET